MDFTVKPSKSDTEERAVNVQKNTALSADQGSTAKESREAETITGLDQVFEDIKELIMKRTIQVVGERQETGESLPVIREETKQSTMDYAHREPEFKTLITENTLNQLSIEAYNRKDIVLIQCDKKGECEDGIRVGEVFSDSHGVKWQRTFIETTRLPIYLNFIVEEASIRGKVGKAFNVITSRGARALIPEDYICEAINKYGLEIEIDKCLNYKIISLSEKTKKKGG